MELFVVGKDIMRNNTENNEIFLIEVDREKNKRLCGGS